jgi:protein TonB
VTTLSPHCPDTAQRHKQGWIYSVLLHAMMGTGAFALASSVTPSFEPDSFRWNVALVQSPAPQPATTPVPEFTPQPKHVEPVVKPVQRQVAQPVEEILPVNHTASTFIPQTVRREEVSEPVAPQEPMVQETQPIDTKIASIQEPVAPPIMETVAEPAPQQAAVEPAPVVTMAPVVKADYGWLMKSLLSRINELKNYPHMARMNHWEGKVVLRAVIKDDGQVLMVDVQESSGRSILDNDAMETLRKASPLKLEQPLGKPQVAILMPISYSLR